MNGSSSSVAIGAAGLTHSPELAQIKWFRSPQDENLPVINASTKTIIGHLANHAVTQGASPALHVFEHGSGITITYEALYRQASAYAVFLRDAGVVAGDLVFLCLKHGVDPYIAYLGTMALGAVPSFLAFPTSKQDPLLYWETHRSLFHMMQGAAAVTYPENAADLAAVLPPETRLLIKPAQVTPDPRALSEITAGLPIFNPRDISLVQFSSGTTGLRKGVALSHQQIADQVEAYSAAIDAKDGYRVASWLPLYHDMGLMTAFLFPVWLGGMVVSLDPFEWVNDPHMLFEMMDRYQCHYAWLPNFTFSHLVRTKIGDETYQLGHIKALINAAEPCKKETFDRFVQAFAQHGIRPEQLQTLYGMAETVIGVAQSRLGAQPRTVLVDADALAENRLVIADDSTVAPLALLSNGPCIDGIEARIAGGDIGEIQVRGRFVFDGYFKAADTSADVFDGDWFRTGDIGCLIDGEVYVVGRIKDIIISHGRNYYAHDIEAAAASVSGIKAGRCVAVGVWNNTVGSEEVELVAERDPAMIADAAVVKVAVKQAIVQALNLAVAKIHLVDPGWLVKTTSGKISRKENLLKLTRERGVKIKLDDIQEIVIETAPMIGAGSANILVPTIADAADSHDSLAPLRPIIPVV